MSSYVHAINLGNDAITNISGSFSGPQGVAISPDGTTAYVANMLGNTISIINTATNTVTGTISDDSDPYFVFPYSLVISPDGNTLYMENTTGTASGGFVSIGINQNYQTLDRFTGYKPYGGIALSNDGNTLYFPYDGGSPYRYYAEVNTSNPSAMTEIARYHMTYSSSAVALTPDDSILFMATRLADNPAQAIANLATSPTITDVSTGVSGANFISQQGHFIN